MNAADLPLRPAGGHRYLLVTGRLAEESVRRVADKIRREFGVPTEVAVMPITVAALMTPRWLGRHLKVPAGVTHVLTSGYLAGDTRSLDPVLGGARLVAGPTECRDLPRWLGGKDTPPDLTRHSIEIIAEINHVPRRSVDDVVAIAETLRTDGADRIDVGADPSTPCRRIAEYVAALVGAGHRVSIDSFDRREVQDAVNAGANLVLSVNGQNVAAAVDWGCEVVAIPDTPSDTDSLDRTVQSLASSGVPFRIDPILEPIGTGLGQSLMRYHQTRRRYPEAAMMMGTGNLTELTDVDSAGVNFLLLGLCQEWGVQSILTTQVINWARSSVRECDIARRLVHHAVTHSVPPKNLSDDLVMLRDRRPERFDEGELERLAAAVRDNNYRIAVSRAGVRMLAAGVDLEGTDVFEIFAELLGRPQSTNIDASHAFYLGYEMAKAEIAGQLGKRYVQDQPLRWGHLTPPPRPHARR